MHSNVNYNNDDDDDDDNDCDDKYDKPQYTNIL